MLLSSAVFSLAGYRQIRNCSVNFTYLRYNERTNLEVKLFDIQMKYRGSKQKTWNPSDGKLVSDLNRLWIALEGAEHEREAALRKELMR